jgi:TetR/AcrR family transcriptional regulator, regulator of cefoperazone and chloramphenicol sensitivity
MSTTRSYHSSLRAEQARETRLRIQQAAREVFGSQGFAATTITEIAKVAGVSPATLYAAFESKAGIVAAMLETMEEDVGIGPRLEELLAESEPYEQMRAYVALHCDLFTNGRDILRAAMRAIETPEVAAMAEEGDRHRRAVIETLVGRWHEAGVLRRDLTPHAAADRLWLLTTVEGFLNAVDRLSWEPVEYEAWLARLAQSEILEPMP